MYEKLREQFEVNSNSILLHGSNAINGNVSNRISIPGGCGACGAPNDAWHQWYHYLRRGWQRLRVGMGASVHLRKTAADWDVGNDGNARFQ